ncbi:MAG: hypothetical protein ACKO8L_06180 [Flavobacterium sp.]
MKGFIRVTQTNNQGTYVNVNNILTISKTVEGCSITLIGNVIIETKLDFDKAEDLVNNAFSF